MTGGEQIIPQIVSSRFAYKAKDDGIVKEIVPNETMTVSYNNGKEETIDILPRKSQTKRGAFISLEMKPLEEGVRFKKNQLLASSKNFINESSTFVSGKNVSIAVMSYLGYTYEDGYVISDKLADSTTTDTVKEISVIVPPETKVFKLEDQIGKKTELGDELVEFAYEEDVNNYLLANEFDVNDDEVDMILGAKSSSIALKSPGGEIVDIKIFVNDKLKADSSLIQMHKKLVEKTNQIHEKLKVGKVNKYEELTASDNLESNFFKIGGHKVKGQEFKGVRISYLIKIPKPLRAGDKIAPRFGAKGLVAKIYKQGSAYSASNTNIDCFISPASIIGRKNLAFVKEIYLGKLAKTLRDRVDSMVNNPKVETQTIIKFILDFYKLISSEKTYKSMEEKFGKMTPNNIRTFLKNKELNLCLIVEPFFDISFRSIKTAAKLLKVELDEYVTITTEDGKKITSDRPVPVGITYMQFLEQKICSLIIS